MLSCTTTYRKGPFINYIRIPREAGGGNNLYILLLWGGGGQTHSYVIFSKSIFYIRNHAVKWFGRDFISFASGRYKKRIRMSCFLLVLLVLLVLIYVKLGVLV